MTTQPKLNENALFAGLVVALGLIAVFLVSTYVFNSVNPIASISGVVGSLLLICGVVNPNRMLFAMVPITLYLDSVKRMLVFSGETSLDNVTSVLSIAPLTVAGILIGCVFRRIFRRKRGTTAERIAIVAALAAYVAFGGLETFSEGNLLFALRTIANTTVYFLLGWAVLHCFKTKEDVERYLRFSLLVGVPVALYGVWQYLMGLNDFEIAYLRSGLSITASNLDDVRPRPFSTLSSAHAYSIVMTFMLAVSVHFAMKTKVGEARWKWGAVVSIYAMGLLFSLSRSATVAGLLMLGFSVLFRSAKGVSLAYLISGILLAIFVIFAESIQDNMDKLQSLLPMNSDWQQQAFRLGTFTDRLQSYRNVLGNPSSWPLLANPLSYRANEALFGEAGFTHDLFSQMILRIGAIPVFALIALGLFLLGHAHRAIFKLPAGKVGLRSLAARLMAIIVVYLLSQSGGSGMTVFPLNFWTTMFIGMLAVLCLQERVPPPVQEPRRTQRLPRRGEIGIALPGVPKTR